MAKILKVHTLNGVSLYIDIETINDIPVVNNSNNSYGMPYGQIYATSGIYPIDAITAHFIMAMKMNKEAVENVIDASTVEYDPEANQFTVGVPTEIVPEEDDYPHQMSIDDYVPDAEDINAPSSSDDNADDIEETPEPDQD